MLALLAAAAFGSAADVARQIRETGLDPRECYRVRDLEIRRGEASIFLNEGLLIFQRPVSGRTLAAVFTAEVEGGDAEILLIPPSRSERASLSRFTHTPNLEERFRSAVLLFTDGTAPEMLAAVRQSPAVRPAPEEGFLLAAQWNPVLANLFRSFEVRMMDDLLSSRPQREGFFFATLSSVTLGNFDLLFDPRARRQLMAGQVVHRDGRTFYDIWTNFESRDFRTGMRRPPDPTVKVDNYRIEATLSEDLRLTVRSAMSLKSEQVSASLPFEISPRMQVTAAEIDGRAVEVFARDSVRANMIRGEQNETFLLVPEDPLEPGEHHVVVHHEGDVVAHAGNQVYFVGSRVNWYPLSGTQFAEYDLVFRHPRKLNLVTSGTLVEEHVEGDVRISHRRSGSPVRYAGFNLGDYSREAVEKGGYRVEIYANRQLESALQPRSIPVIPPPQSPGTPRRQPLGNLATLPPATAPSPGARLRQMANEIADQLTWMSDWFGPPPQKLLAVAPIPGNFGQGFPGLIYLSTMAYVELPGAGGREAYFSELLSAHETAHQWWGNSVTSPGYEDDWIQEGLANYIALMALERRRGAKVVDGVLEQYRKRLLDKTQDGETIESLGPVTLGLRLQNSRNTGAWRAIVYDKGAWIFHMLRRRMGDAAFRDMLATVAERWREEPLSTSQLRMAAAEFLEKQPNGNAHYRSVDPKLETFFDTWTGGTGIPELRLKWSAKGVAPKVAVTVTVEQSGVPDDFTDAVPVELQLARGKSVTRWMRTSSSPVTITQILPSKPVKVLLDPANATLKR